MTFPKKTWQVLGFALELGFMIALPIVILGSLGKYADAKWNTYPWLTLLGILLAIVATSYWMYRYLSSLMSDQIKSSEKNNNKN